MSRLRFHVVVKGKGDAVAVQNHSIILHLHFQEQVATINIQLIAELQLSLAAMRQQVSEEM